MSQEDSGASDSSDDTEIIKQKASRFLSEKGVPRPWKEFILETRSDIILKDMVDRNIQDWKKWFDDLRKQEVIKFLNRKEVPPVWKEWFTRSKEEWQNLADRMTFNKKMDQMKIDRWDAVYAEIQKRLVSQFLSNNTVNKHWKDFILSRDDIWKYLADKMITDTSILYWEEWFDNQQKRGVSQFLQAMEVDLDMEDWVINITVCWKDLADQMVYDRSSNTMRIDEWCHVWDDLRCKYRVWEVLLDWTVDFNFVSWILTQNTTWRELYNNIESENVQWEQVLSDIRKRLVRRCLEDNVVDTVWQAFIMNNENIMQQLANSIIRLDLFLYIQQDRSELYPDRNKVLAAFRYCPFSALKVVLFGEDPRKPQATGLAFSYDEGTIESNQNNLSAVRKIHVVLRKICQSSPPNSETSCCHVNWAKRGVLLLNSALTYTKKDDKDEHKAIWECFMRELMDALFKKYLAQELDVLCWSSASRELFPPHQGDQCNHRIYHGPHPAEREGKFADGVIGALTTINARYPDIFKLEKIDDTDGLTHKFANKFNMK